MANKPLTAAVSLALLAPLLSGCIFFESPRERAMRRDPTFLAGYSDGCASANNRGANIRTSSEVKDPALWATSQVYRAGWGNGYGVCNRQGASGPDPNRGAMPTQRLPGQL